MKQYKFTIASKIETYNGEKKIKHSAIKISLEPDYSRET